MTTIVLNFSINVMSRITKCKRNSMKHSGECLNLESRNPVPGDLVKLSSMGLIARTTKLAKQRSYMKNKATVQEGVM